MLYWPSGQGAHTAAPLELENVPAAQGRQRGLKAGLTYVPAEQLLLLGVLHKVAPAGAMVSLGQAAQSVRAPLLKEGLKVLTGQGVCVVALRGQ